MLDTILSVITVVLLAFSMYAVVMCIWIAKQVNKAEKAFWNRRAKREVEHDSD